MIAIPKFLFSEVLKIIDYFIEKQIRSGFRRKKQLSSSVNYPRGSPIEEQYSNY